jgi:hypothetical protein
VNAYAYYFELCDGGADVDSVAAQPVKFGDDQDVAFFHPIEQFGKPCPLRDSHGAGDRFGDDAMCHNGKASGFDFVDLVFGRLLKC